LVFLRFDGYVKIPLSSREPHLQRAQLPSGPFLRIVVQLPALLADSMPNPQRGTVPGCWPGWPAEISTPARSRPLRRSAGMGTGGHQRRNKARQCMGKCEV